MMKTQTTDKKPCPVAINMRVDASKRNLIDTAAALLGSDRTSFIISAACKTAEEVLLEKRLFVLDTPAFEAFERAVTTSSTGENECLETLKNRPRRWD